MKITIYELLGMVKDGKAPKKFKYDNYEWTYNYESSAYWNGKGLEFEDYMESSLITCLNEPVEIIEETPIVRKLYINNELQYDLEEEKKIPEKLPLIKNTVVNYPDDEFIERILNLFYELNNKNRLKINEIIDCLDYLKSKGDE